MLITYAPARIWIASWASGSTSFDTGMAVAFLQLRATELDLVAHPFAGFKPKAVAEILNIPEDMTVIALVAVGKRSRNSAPPVRAPGQG